VQPALSSYHDYLLTFAVTESGLSAERTGVNLIRPATDLADLVSFAGFHQFVKEKQFTVYRADRD
jgi:hypothetical protein